MTIKLLFNLPVAEQHGATKDRIFEAAPWAGERRRGAPDYEIIGDIGDKVGVFAHECEVCTSEPSTQT